MNTNLSTESLIMLKHLAHEAMDRKEKGGDRAAVTRISRAYHETVEILESRLHVGQL